MCISESSPTLMIWIEWHNYSMTRNLTDCTLVWSASALELSIVDALLSVRLVVHHTHVFNWS